MFSIFKDLFHPKSVVGLQIDGGVIRAVQVANPAGSPVVERLLRHEVADPAEMGKELADFFKRENLKTEDIITSIPTSRAAIREITLPLKNIKKIEKIIKFQAEPHLPWPIEETVVDFLPAEPGRPMLVMGVPKTRLSEHISVLAGAALDSALVTLEDAALFYLFVHLHSDRKEQPTAIVHLKGGETVVQIVYRQKPLLLRVGLDDAADLHCLKETLALHRLRQPDRPVAEILVTGAAAGDRELIGKIESFTGIPTSLWKPLEKVKNLSAESGDKVHAEMSVPLGLALGLIHATPKTLDFRKEEFSLRTPFELKNRVVYAMSAIIVLMGLLTFAAYHRLSQWQKKYEVLNARLAGTLTETFPGSGAVIRGRELEQLRQKITREKNRFQWLENINATGSVLDVLTVLTDTFKIYSDVTVDNISIEGIRILLDGRAASFKTVDSLKGALEKSEFFRSIRLVGAKMDNQDNVVRFGFHLEKKK